MTFSNTSKRALAAGIGALVLAMPFQAGAAIYIKFDGVEGESGARPGIDPDEIDARATARAPGVEPDEIDARATARSGHTGHGHEAEYDLVAAPAAAAGKDHKDWIPIESMAAPVFRERASGQATGKRQHKPVTVTNPVAAASPQRAVTPDVTLQLPPSRGPGNVTLKRGTMACVAGTHFPSAQLRDDAGNHAQLLDVTVASCAGEQISLNYEEIK